MPKIKLDSDRDPDVLNLSIIVYDEKKTYIVVSSGNVNVIKHKIN